VIILNWNGADDTLACLESLRASSIELHVIVVDNGSTDDSVTRISQSGLADEVLATGANCGFADGNNRGLRLALDRGSDVIVVLNNDTTVESHAIERLVAALSTPDPLAVSPDIRYFDSPDESWFRGGVIDHGWPRHLQPGEAPEGGAAGDPDVVGPSPILTGCCLAARRHVWERVGPFDPAYFLIFEDSDWSLRAAAAGVSMCVVHDSRIFHRVSRSIGSGPASVLASYYFVRNGLRFQTRYFGRERVRFLWTWVARPAIGIWRRRLRTELLFRTLGAFGFGLGQSGRAPRWIERLAAHMTEKATKVAQRAS
jgi:hypothetical protein